MMEWKNENTEWNIMRRGPLLFFAFVFLGIGLSIPLVHAQLGDYSGEFAYLAEIQGTTFLPNTIYAGDVVSLAVDVHNKGASITIQDLNGLLDIGEQFDPMDIEDGASSILPDATKTLVFTFRIKADTPPSHYPTLLTLSYIRNGVPVTENHEIIIPVSGAEKNIDVTLEPRIINPGNQTNVTFTLTNVGGTAVSNISFSWTEESSLILPVGTDNKRYIPIIPAGEKATLQYTVAADPNITTGIYPLSINVSFTDSNGDQEQASEIGVIIGGKTDFEVSGEMVSNQLSVSIANIGSNNAGAVVAKLLNVSSSGSNISILGNLNKGDFTIATFQLGTASGLSGTGTMDTSTLPQGSGTDGFGSGFQGRPTGRGDTNMFAPPIPRTLELEIAYTDTTGERQTVTKTISLSANSLNSGIGQTNRAMSTGLSPLLAWGLLAVVLIGGIGYNHFKAKREWTSLLKVLAGIVVVFLISILLLNRNEIAIGVSCILSLIGLVLFFRNDWREKAKTLLNRSSKKEKR
ncbi:MAG: hypothetical protein V1776_03730 [Candidatus Diapherotrites archaeon]